MIYVILSVDLGCMGVHRTLKGAQDAIAEQAFRRGFYLEWWCERRTECYLSNLLEDRPYAVSIAELELKD